MRKIYTKLTIIEPSVQTVIAATFLPIDVELVAVRLDGVELTSVVAM